MSNDAHHTDAERAEFEAWYEADAMPAEADWFAREKDEPSEYKHADTASAWRGWQAARRAPAAPVPQGWRDGVLAVADMLKKKADAFADAHGYDDMGGLSFGQGSHADAKLEHHSNLLELEEEVRAMLAAAPKPPEAAPVELPKPEYFLVNIIDGDGVSRVWFDTKPQSGATPVYTEQQVRELLAAKAKYPTAELKNNPRTSNISAQEIGAISNKLFALALANEEVVPKWRPAFGQGVAWALQYTNGEIDISNFGSGIPDGYKVCRVCGTTKPATSEFFYKSPTARDKLSGRCIVCTLAYQKSKRAGGSDQTKQGANQ